jgi:uncharacterized protein YhaN
MSDTPRTDATQKLKDIIGDEYVSVDFARLIERELAEYREQLKANHKATEMLERMVYEAREQRDRLANALERWPEIREWLEMSSFIKSYMQCESAFFDGISSALDAVKGGGL